MKDLPADQLLTVLEVATYLQVDAETVRRWLRGQQMRGTHLGNRAGWRVRPEEVERFISERST